MQEQNNEWIKDFQKAVKQQKYPPNEKSVPIPLDPKTATNPNAPHEQPDWVKHVVGQSNFNYIRVSVDEYLYSLLRTSKQTNYL